MVGRVAGGVRGRGGATRYGCVLTLLVLAVVGYYSVDVADSYVRYWRLLDEMKSMAQHAPGLDDATIRRRLVAKVRELRLPGEAQRFVIRRLARPREIRITTSYAHTFTFPFKSVTYRFTPEARAPL